MKLHILAIAAHPDDVELSAAGTIIKHVLKGQAVGILDLTMGELGTRGTPKIRYEESMNSAKIMGLAVRENAMMEDGFFGNDKEHQLRLAKYIRHYQPEIVIANALHDRHPDHRRGGRLIADACFIAGLRKVETSWEGEAQTAWRPKRVYHMIQDRIYEPTFIVDISATFDKKMETIRAFKSQFHNPESDEPITYIATDAFIKNIEFRASTLGKQIGTRYAEGFICENLPGMSDLDSLLLPELA